jgi:hypothetical protein
LEGRRSKAIVLQRDFFFSQKLFDFLQPLFEALLLVQKLRSQGLQDFLQGLAVIGIPEHLPDPFEFQSQIFQMSDQLHPRKLRRSV